MDDVSSSDSRQKHRQKKPRANYILCCLNGARRVKIGRRCHRVRIFEYIPVRKIVQTDDEKPHQAVVCRSPSSHDARLFYPPSDFHITHPVSDFRKSYFLCCFIPDKEADISVLPTFPSYIFQAFYPPEPHVHKAMPQDQCPHYMDPHNARCLQKPPAMRTYWIR